MLTKEKNYYQKKVDTLSRQQTVAVKADNGAFADLERQLEKAKSNIEQQKLLIDKQTKYIEDMEGRMKEKNTEILRLQKSLKDQTDSIPR